MLKVILGFLLIGVLPVLRAGQVRAEPARRVRLLTFNKSRVPPDPARKGRIVAGARWSDSNGTNLLLMTETGEYVSKRDSADGDEEKDAELYAYHYVLQSGGRWRLLWRVYDYEKSCPYDVSVEFLPGSLTITDLDNDGVAETTFLYKLGCRSDVSPLGLKLILHEGRTKYAIRGSMRVKPGPEGYYGGDKRIDPAYSRAPRAFKEHSLKQWNRFVNETFN